MDLLAGAKSPMRLKIQRRVIEEQLKQTDDRMARLGEILLKKSSSSGRQEEFSHPENYTLTLTGKTVGDLRLPARSVKAVPKVTHYDPNELDPQAITNPNILRIRQDFLLRTKGRDDVKSYIKQKELEEKLREEQRQKKIKKIPIIKIPESMLPNRYKRGELPCTIEHGTSGQYLSWACPLENLDYEYYLPIFYDGLQCKDHITAFLARQGIEDMLYAAKGHPERIIPTIPSLIRPLRNALSKFDSEVLLAVLKALEQLIMCNVGIGEVLLPYAKQFLVPIAYFLDQHRNIGDAIDYGQRRNDDIEEQVRRVLELMEEHGGKDALRHIKFAVPTYQSCMTRPDAHHLRKAAAAAAGTTGSSSATRGSGAKARG